MPLPKKSDIIKGVFSTRSLRPERIDTGDYTPEEYDRFLREIAFINRVLGDGRALRKTLFREIARNNVNEFSLLDVGAGSGELLRYTADFACKSGIKARLTGIDLSSISAGATRAMSAGYPEIASIRGDALKLPFADASFDYAISSLFFHHLTDEQIAVAFREMSRVARRAIFVIDLHRHPAAFVLFKLFCTAFRISPLVREDGSLSVLRGFRPSELEQFARALRLRGVAVRRVSPFRLVLTGKGTPQK